MYMYVEVRGPFNMGSFVTVLYTKSVLNTMKNDRGRVDLGLAQLKSSAGSLPPNVRMQLA